MVEGVVAKLQGEESAVFCRTTVKLQGAKSGSVFSRELCNPHEFLHPSAIALPEKEGVRREGIIPGFSFQFLPVIRILRIAFASVHVALRRHVGSGLVPKKMSV